MNKITLTKKKDSTDPNTVEVFLSAAIAEKMEAVLKEAFFVPVVSGSRTVLKNGDVELKFILPDDDAILLKQAILNVFAQESGYYTSN